MWKWLIVALAVVVLYKLITNDRGRKSKSDDKSRERKIASGRLVPDPVCGAYVDSESSISVRDGKTVHRFCSYDCRTKFLEKLQESGRDIPELENKDDE